MKPAALFFRTFLLAIFTLSLLAGAIVTDYYLRHEVTRKAKRYLVANQTEISSASAVAAAQSADLETLKQLEIVGISLGLGDVHGMTPLLAAVKAERPNVIDFLLERNTVKVSIDRTTEPERENPLSVVLTKRDFSLADRLIDSGASLNVDSEPGTPFFLSAIRTNDVEMIDYLLAKGVDPDYRGTETAGALATAADKGDIPLMKKILAAGANPNVYGLSGNSLLAETIHSHHRDQFDLLMKNHADVNLSMGKATGGWEMTALSYATESGDKEIQDILLNAGAKIEIAGTGGDPLICEAVEARDMDLITRLLDKGVNCQVLSSKKRSPLMTAVLQEDPDLVDLLLSKGADPSFADTDGMAPLSMAVKLGNLVIVHQILSAGKITFDGPALLAESYERRDDPLMRVLLKSGVDPESRRPGGQERIFDIAVREGASGAVRTLLSAGAQIGDNLWAALLTGQDDLIRLILAAGGNPRQPGPNGQDPLDYCLSNERYAAARELLAGGADPDAHFDTSETWLAKSISEGNADIALALLDAGATAKDVKMRDGHSLLGWAIANKMPDVVTSLLKAGADPDAEEKTPATENFRGHFESTTFRYHLQVDSRIRPIMLAAAQRDHKMAQALMDAGAKKNSYSRKYLSGAIIGSWYKDVKLQQICLLGRTPSVQPRKVVVSLSRQTVTLYENGVATFSTPCSTGMSGYGTPRGEYVISDKNRHHTSTIYNASMPFFQRFSFSAFGLHQGHLPGYPASHGCIRLSYNGAQHLFSKLQVGDYAVVE